MTKKTTKDKDVSDIEINRIEHFNRVGQRLKEIRLNEKINIVDLEAELEYPRRTIARIESGEGGNSKSLISLIYYFMEKGYNVNWIIAMDNSNTFKKEQGIMATIDLGIASNLIDEASENIKDLKKIFSKMI